MRAIYLLLFVPLVVHADPETGPQPRLIADFDLSEYKPVTQAKTTKLAPPGTKVESSGQPAYLGVLFEQTPGALRVVDLDPISPAKGTLKAGDEVRSFDGKSFPLNSLRDFLLTKEPGEDLKLVIQRGPEKLESTVKLGTASKPYTNAPTTGGRTPRGSSRGMIGIRTEKVNSGILISSVTEGLPAEKAGLKEGDILIKVDGKPTKDVDSLTELMTDKRAGDSVELVYVRGTKEEKVKLTLASQTGGQRPQPGGGWDTRRNTTFRKPVYNLAVIEIAYPDVEFNKKISAKNWEDALFSKGVYNQKSVTGQTVYGSMNDYYMEQSYGKVSVKGKVFEPVVVSKKRDEYTSDRVKTALLSEALDVLVKREGRDAMKDFDGIFFMYAGRRVQTNRGGLYWPHRSSLSYGGQRYSYFICPEGGENMADISTICHEFGHMLGLPDLYARPENPGMEGVGRWCAMSNQAPGGRPQHFCAWSKEQMGWVEPVLVDPTTPQKLILSDINSDNKQCIKVLTKPDGSEYYLLEVRKQAGFDKSLPAEGLLIWHVQGGRPLLMESHGITTADGPGRYPEAVPFPSKANNSFTPYTTPSSKSTTGGKPVFITNIRKLSDGRITLMIGYEYF
ncbi:MAG: M6 family metalloprotease domain-containing protein [Zavarzinella sp.]